MKKTLWMLSFVVACTAPSWADYQVGNQIVNLHLGPASYAKDLKVNNGDNTLRDCGGGGGFQYLYLLHKGPTLAIGPDIFWADFTEDNPSTIIPGSKSKSDAHAAIYQVLAKMVFPSGRWRPYVLGGLGGERSSLQSHISSASGADVQTFDSVRSGFAGTWGIGIDFFPREHWFVGLELRQNLLSKLNHDPTDAGKALGVQSTREPSSITTTMISMGYKFGAN